jgi:hypothetical protein
LDDRPGFGRAVVKPGLDVDFRTGDGSVAAQDELGLDGATLEGASPAEGRTAMSLNTQDSGTEALVAAVAAAAASVPAPEKENSRTVRARRFGIVTDESRDALLTAFGKDTLDDRYLLPGESTRTCSPAWPMPMPMTRRTPSGSTTTSRSCGSCPPRRSSRTAAPGAVADLVLPQFGGRQPGRHRRHLERERLARQPGRRHRHLLGPGARHRRAWA